MPSKRRGRARPKAPARPRERGKKADASLVELVLRDVVALGSQTRAAAKHGVAQTSISNWIHQPRWATRLVELRLAQARATREASAAFFEQLAAGGIEAAEGARLAMEGKPTSLKPVEWAAMLRAFSGAQRDAATQVGDPESQAGRPLKVTVVRGAGVRREPRLVEAE